MAKDILRTLFHPRAAIVLHDLCMVWCAWTLVFFLRYLYWPSSPSLELWTSDVAIVLCAQGLVLSVLGLYRGIWRFASLPDLWNIMRGAIYGTLLITLILFLVKRLDGVPRSVFIIYPLLLTVLLGAPRLLYRVWKDHRLQFHARPGQTTRVLILGAGTAGEMLARDLLNEGSYYPIGFLDDNRQLRGGKLRGIPVFGPIDDLRRQVEDRAVDLIVIAIPSATSSQMQRIVGLCESTGRPFRKVPRMHDMVSGKVGVEQLKDVAIEDLLGRDPVELDWVAMGSAVAGKSIVVTGGGGSIGSELCRQIAQLGPARLTFVERNEYNLYRCELELRQQFPDLVLAGVLGDVVDQEFMERVFSESRPSIVFHAAAYKHVPLLESQARQAVINNVFGTRSVAYAAERAGVDRFVLISTDKAVNPVNIMGATKRAAEIYCQHIAAHSKTLFLTVRFGNVLDSAGSVVPLFREQIRSGRPVTVTDPSMTRFFMTIPEACQLILEVGAVGKSAELYVLDMGEPVRIQYLAEQMIRLSGKEPGRDVQIVYTGLRPGEKLFEELFHEAEACVVTSHDRVLRARSREIRHAEVRRLLAQLESDCARFDEARIRQTLEQLVPEYGLASESTSLHDENIIKLRK